MMCGMLYMIHSEVRDNLQRQIDKFELWCHIYESDQLWLRMRGMQLVTRCTMWRRRFPCLDTTTRQAPPDGYKHRGSRLSAAFALTRQIEVTRDNCVRGSAEPTFFSRGVTPTLKPLVTLPDDVKLTAKIRISASQKYAFFGTSFIAPKLINHNQ
jgi:hypothetical protein